jgi:hypothetical protein
MFDLRATKLCLVSTTDDDLAAGHEEAFGYRQADTGSASGDEHGIRIDLHRVTSYFWWY